MIVDERGKPFRTSVNFGAMTELTKRWLDMEVRKLLEPSPLVRMLKLGELRAAAEACQRWENRGTLPPAGTIKFKMAGRYD